jgi:hypothetical protein
MSKAACILVLMLLVAPAASAEIFRCAEKDGIDRYQNFPCDLESIGLPPATTGIQKASGTSESKATKPSAANVEGAATRKASIGAREPRPGMTAEEVKAIWGEPISGYQDEVVEGRIEVWSYGSSRAVQFDQRGKVTLVRP